MNANKIQVKGFSNPDTERVFASWPDEHHRQLFRQGRLCGLCAHCFFTEDRSESVVCLNPDSPHCYETVDSCFSCALHQHFAQPVTPGA